MLEDRIKTLEEEVKKLKEEIEKIKQGPKETQLPIKPLSR